MRAATTADGWEAGSPEARGVALPLVGGRPGMLRRPRTTQSQTARSRLVCTRSQSSCRQTPMVPPTLLQTSSHVAGAPAATLAVAPPKEKNHLADAAPTAAGVLATASRPTPRAVAPDGPDRLRCASPPATREPRGETLSRGWRQRGCLFPTFTQVEPGILAVPATAVMRSLSGPAPRPPAGWKATDGHAWRGPFPQEVRGLATRVWAPVGGPKRGNGNCLM